jgi:hypothetical protein
LPVSEPPPYNELTIPNAIIPPDMTMHVATVRHNVSRPAKSQIANIHAVTLMKMQMVIVRNDSKRSLAGFTNPLELPALEGLVEMGAFMAFSFSRVFEGFYADLEIAVKLVRALRAHAVGELHMEPPADIPFQLFPELFVFPDFFATGTDRNYFSHSAGGRQGLAGRAHARAALHVGADIRMVGVDCPGFVIELLQSVGILPHKGDWNAVMLYAYLLEHGSLKWDPLMSLGSGMEFFCGAGVRSITYVDLVLDADTATQAAPSARNAFVKMRPIGYRRDIAGILDPFHDER